MSIINKMLQDLDRRQGRADPDATLVQQVRTVAAPRKEREWFWRIIAVLMVASVGWVAWIAWQLQPRPQIATEQALKAAQNLQKKPAPAVQPAAPAPVPAPTPAPAAPTSTVAEAKAADAPAPPPPPAVTTPPTVPPAAPPDQAVVSAPAAVAPAPVPAAPKPAAKPVAAPAAAKAQEAVPARRAEALAANPQAAAPRGLNLDVPPARIYQAPPAAAAKVEKRDRERTSEDRAESDFRRGAVLLNQGRAGEAEELFGSAIAISPSHEAARQALVALSLEHNKVEDARRLLQEGVAINPGNARFASVLARIHLERRNYAAAIDVVNNVRHPEQGQADLQLMRGTALQKLGRHAEAIESFQNAARAEQNGPALIGLATSLESLARRQEAADAYKRAAASATLSEDVRTYAAQRARALQ